VSAPGVFVLDSDVFIAAKNTYYAFEICPGFWASLLHGHEQGRVQSIDQIRRELLAGAREEDLVLWVKQSVPSEFFQSTETEDVLGAYSAIMGWVQESTQFFPAAKDKFATEADGWLVAYSMVHRTTVVTNEQPRPGARNRVLLPDVCKQFNVPTMDTFTMLRGLTVRLDLRP
jgi:hypothetical protein